MLSTCVLRLLSATTIGDADAELCSIGSLPLSISCNGPNSWFDIVSHLKYLLFDVVGTYRNYSGIFWDFRLVEGRLTGVFDTTTRSHTNFFAIIFCGFVLLIPNDSDYLIRHPTPRSRIGFAIFYLSVSARGPWSGSRVGFKSTYTGMGGTLRPGNRPELTADRRRK